MSAGSLLPPSVPPASAVPPAPALPPPPASHSFLLVADGTADEAGCLRADQVSAAAVTAADAEARLDICAQRCLDLLTDAGVQCHFFELTLSSYCKLFPTCNLSRACGPWARTRD